MKTQNERFAPRIYSQFLEPISITYRGEHSAGQGIVQELSRVGCRILGNGPVEDRESLRVQISLPTSQPLIIEQATVKWVKGLEFGLAFKRLPALEASRLQELLTALLDSGSYSALAEVSLHVKLPAA